MPEDSIAVLGGGNTAFSVAANLTLKGTAVTLYELPAFADSIRPIQQSREIGLDGVDSSGVAKLAHLTTDAAQVLCEHDLLLLIVPAYGHLAFAEICAPHVRPGQMVVIMPGTLGSLEFVHVLRRHGTADDVIVAETDTAPYVCRKTSPTTAHIWGVVSGLGLGVFPSSAGSKVRERLEPHFPGVRLLSNVVACGLAAMNPVVHPAGVLLNAGRIERARGEFYFYEEGVTPGVCRLIEGIDRERLAIASSLGLNLSPVAEAFHEAGFGPPGDLWSTINGSRMLTQLRAPGVLETRWLTEDVPYGLAAWVELGKQLGVDCPQMRAVVDIASVVLGADFWHIARTSRRLGIAGLDAAALLDYVS